MDKTPLIHRLMEEGKFYFFARPRRFGKSLLLDTIAQIFLGNRDLFSGLYLDNHWNWDDSYPVIRIDLAESILNTRDRLDDKLRQQIDFNAAGYGIHLQREEVSDRFCELIHGLHNNTGRQVVVLVDEYDKPILDNVTDKKVQRNSAMACATSTPYSRRKVRYSALSCSSGFQNFPRTPFSPV